MLNSLSFGVFVGYTHIHGIQCHFNSPEKVCGSRALENNLLCNKLHFSSNLSNDYAILTLPCLKEAVSLSGDNGVE